MFYINILLIALVLVGIAIIVKIVFQKDKAIQSDQVDQDTKDNIFSIKFLTHDIKTTINDILHMNVEELNLNRIESEKRENLKGTLRSHLRSCSFGDIGAKEYVKDFIKDLLLKKYQITEDNINNIINFDDKGTLTTIDKYDIVLYLYKKKYAYKGLSMLIEDYSLDQAKEDEDGIYYEIDNKDIVNIYSKIGNKLEFVDKLEIVAQRVYQKNYGHGVIDETRDMRIDGVSGGIYGIDADSYCYVEEELENAICEAEFTYNGIAIMHQGKTIHMSFMGFGSSEELQRVCRNIYRYNSPGQLSQERGYIENDMKDGSRVVVVRPPFSNSWAFFVRKHGIGKVDKLENILTDDRKEIPINLLGWAVKGCCNIVITGDQGGGKTTLLRTLIKYIPRNLTIRIQEQLYELHLEKLFKKKNIVTFKEIPSVSGQEGLNLQKRTDGAVNILGEITKYEVASWFIQMSQAASKFTMCTHHANTTAKLIEWMTDALLKEGGYTGSSVKEARREVVEAINLDVHMTLDQGHRFIDRITEIRPKQDSPYPEKTKDQIKTFFERMTNPIVYEAIDIVTYENGKYVLKNKISDHLYLQIKKYLSNHEMQEFYAYWNEVTM